jgi:hypothetical protein
MPKSHKRDIFSAQAAVASCTLQLLMSRQMVRRKSDLYVIIVQAKRCENVRRLLPRDRRTSGWQRTGFTASKLIRAYRAQFVPQGDASRIASIASFLKLSFIRSGRSSMYLMTT